MTKSKDQDAADTWVLVLRDMLYESHFWYPEPYCDDELETESMYWSEVDLLGYEVTGETLYNG